jgi:hypothetical protein
MFSDSTPHHSASGINSAPIQDSHDGPNIREAVKRHDQTELGESLAGSAFEFPFLGPATLLTHVAQTRAMVKQYQSA